MQIQGDWLKLKKFATRFNGPLTINLTGMKQTPVTKFFVDSNIVLYSIGPDIAKASRANALLMRRPIISVQVLNEFIRVATRKFKLSLPDALIALVPTKLACDIVPLTLAIHEYATDIAKHDNINIFDANVIAAAELSGCDVLYSEDMNHGQKFGRVTIVNPFMAA